jgi:hypothetical protein
MSKGEPEPINLITDKEGKITLGHLKNIMDIHVRPQA